MLLGKPWLLYLHNKMEETGDRAFNDCAYSVLPDDVMFDGSEGDKSRAESGKKKGTIKPKQRDDEKENKVTAYASVEKKNSMIVKFRQSRFEIANHLCMCQQN